MSLTIIAILAAILFPVFAKAREKARQTACLNNQRQIVTAILLYTQDHEELLPSMATVWGDINLDKGVLICPTAGSKVANGYGYNDAMVLYPSGTGKAIGEIDNPQAKIVTADMVSSSANRVLRLNGDVEYRHGGKAVASYLDGHAEMGSDFVITSVVTNDPLMDDLASLSSGSSFPASVGAWTRSGTDFTNTTSGRVICWTRAMTGKTGSIGIGIWQKSGQNDGDSGNASNQAATCAITVPAGTITWGISGYVRYNDLGSLYVQTPMAIAVRAGGTDIVALNLWSNYNSNAQNLMQFVGKTTQDVFPMGNYGGREFITKFVPFSITVDKSTASLDFNGTTAIVTPNTATPMQPTSVVIRCNKQSNSNMTINFTVSDLMLGSKQ